MLLEKETSTGNLKHSGFPLISPEKMIEIFTTCSEEIQLTCKKKKNRV